MEDPPEDREELTLEGALTLADEAQDDLEQVFAALASSIDITGDIESLMERRRAERDASLLLLGRHVLQWFRSGGGFILEPPEDEEAAEEPPAEEPPAEEPPAEEPPAEEPPAEEPPVTAELPEEEAPTEEVPGTEPVPVEPPPPVVPQEPASLESIQHLTAGGLGVSWSAAVPVSSSLDRILDELAPAPSDVKINAQLERIQALNPHTWRGLPKSIQKDLTALLATWGRHLQEHLSEARRPELTAFFGRLTEFSEREQPGFVFGLARQHRPRGASWLADALQVWQRLAPAEVDPVITPELALQTLQSQLHRSDIRPAVLAALASGLKEEDPRLIQLLSERLSDLGKEPRLRKVRKAIRRHNNQNRQKQPATPVAPWPHRDVTSTWRVIILGGDRPKKLVPLLREQFSFADIRHESGKQMRRVLQLNESIRAGKINLCLVVTRFLSHKASNLVVDACNEHNVTVVKMGSGLNLVPLREALTARLGET